MSRLAQLITFITLGLATPFAAWGLGADITATPDTVVWQTGADAAFDLELPPGVKPPECGLKGIGDEANYVKEPQTTASTSLAQIVPE